MGRVLSYLRKTASVRAVPAEVLAAHAGRPQLNQQNPGLKRNLGALCWAFYLHTGAEEEAGSVGLAG